MGANAKGKCELGQVAFDLAGENLALVIHLSTDRESPSRSMYVDFQGSASKLGMDLPDQPRKQTTSKPEMDEFLRDQTDNVSRFVAKHKSQYIRDMYEVGNGVQSLVFAIDLFQTDQEKRDVAMERLNSSINTIEKTAKNLGIDISEELSKANKPGQLKGKEVDKLRLQLMMKFCTRQQDEKKRSEIDPTRIITNDYWVISLVRLPDTSTNEHTFLVLEGKTCNKSMIWFADFVANDTLDLLRPGIRSGKVRMHYHESEAVVDSSSKLLFRCCASMMEISKGDRLLYSTWSIPKSTAKIFIQNIETWRNKPPKFNSLGNTEMASSGSSRFIGHNSFTFARIMLRNLNDEYIEIPQDTLGKWIVSATHRTLQDKLLDKQWLDRLRFILSLFAILGLGIVVIAFLFPKIAKLF
jgi:hypothetical protein